MPGATSSCHTFHISTIRPVEQVMGMSTHLVLVLAPGHCGRPEGSGRRRADVSPALPLWAQLAVWSCREGLQAQFSRANLVSCTSEDRAQDSREPARRSQRGPAAGHGGLWHGGLQHGLSVVPRQGCQLQQIPDPRAFRISDK